MNKKNHKPNYLRKNEEKTGAQKANQDKVKETIKAFAIALLAAALLRVFVVQAFRIPTGSMKDTLLVGDFLLVNKFVYGVRTPDQIPMVNASVPSFRLPSFKVPQRGDVVVFKHPPFPKPGDEVLDYIKRCIAIGGDTVDVVGLKVFVNGKPEGKASDLGQFFDASENGGRYIRRTQIDSPTGKSYVIRHYEGLEHHQKQRWIVPKGHYFMMGDNRDNSLDSRSWGILPYENVVGEALVIYFSWDKFADWNLLERVRWSRLAQLIK